jgi:hypothetical protein
VVLEKEVEEEYERQEANDDHGFTLNTVFGVFPRTIRLLQDKSGSHSDKEAACRKE